MTNDIAKTTKETKRVNPPAPQDAKLSASILKSLIASWIGCSTRGSRGSITDKRQRRFSHRFWRIGCGPICARAGVSRTPTSRKPA